MPNEQAQAFKQLHTKGDPLLLFNCWDAGSAHAMQRSGAKAIATSSWSVAAAHGYVDGENMPLDQVLHNARRIVAHMTLPVSIDIEGAYGPDLNHIQHTIKQLIDIGVVGVNFEDQIIGGDALYSIQQQCQRIAAIRALSDSLDYPLFINARTDIFLQSPVHDETHLGEALARAKAYQTAGADGFFVPGLQNSTWIATLCQQCDLPINVMKVDDTASVQPLARLGVARISYGPWPYQQMLQGLQAAYQKAIT